MSETQQIVPDEEIYRVHGNANFGSMSKRAVVNEGVVKYAAGYTSGYTQLSILLAHGLVKRPIIGSYRTTLTKKGARYLGAVLRDAGFAKLMGALNVR